MLIIDPRAVLERRAGEAQAVPLTLPPGLMPDLSKVCSLTDCCPTACAQLHVPALPALPLPAPPTPVRPPPDAIYELFHNRLNNIMPSQGFNQLGDMDDPMDEW